MCVFGNYLAISIALKSSLLGHVDTSVVVSRTKRNPFSP
jgi:hypothetical protein